MSNPQIYPQRRGGYGRAEKYNSGVLSKIKTYGTAATGSTGPTAADFVTGIIGLTGQQNTVENKVHIFARLVSNADPALPAPTGAFATLIVWVKPMGREEYYYHTQLEVSKASGRLFSLEDVPPGTYKFGLSRCSDGAATEIRYQVSE